MSFMIGMGFVIDVAHLNNTRLALIWIIALEGEPGTAKGEITADVLPVGMRLFVDHALVELSAALDFISVSLPTTF